MTRDIPKLETERLILKKGTIEDYVKVHEYDFNYLQNIKEKMKLVKNNPDDVRSWFNDDIDEWYKNILEMNHYNFIAFLKDTLEPIADIGFDRNNEENNSIEISCWLHPNYWGKGYMKEALIKAMNYIYSVGFDNIIYGYVETNINSKKLCEKIGFLKYKETEAEEFSTNEGKVKGCMTIMSKERFRKLYNTKIR